MRRKADYLFFFGHNNLVFPMLKLPAKKAKFLVMLDHGKFKRKAGYITVLDPFRSEYSCVDLCFYRVFQCHPYIIHLQRDGM